MASEPQPCLLLHVLPYDGIGGAEIAARRGAETCGGAVRVHSLTKSQHPDGLAAHMTEGTGNRPNSPVAIWGAIGAIRRDDPEVLLFSLWKSIGAFLAARLLFPQKRLCLFLHSDRPANLGDRIATALMIALADEIWSDSRATAIGRIGNRRGITVRIISMILHDPTPAPARRASKAGPRFVSWCRLVREKRMDRAIDFIGALKRDVPEARFTIIGPDHGCRQALERRVEELGLADAVKFVGPRNRDYIEKAAAQSTFYLQTSSQEGQAMAVVEAMRLGLVPVVTRVGEIAHYCEDGKNALIFRSPTQAATEVKALLDEPALLRLMADRAHSTFDNYETYTNSILSAARSAARLSDGTITPS